MPARQCAGSSTLTDAGIKQPSLLLGIHSEKRSACGAARKREGLDCNALSISSAHLGLLTALPHLTNDFFLPGDVALAFGDVPIGLREMPALLVCHRCALSAA